MEVELEGPVMTKRKKNRIKVVEKSDWGEGREKYRKCCKGWTCEQKENESI